MALSPLGLIAGQGNLPRLLIEALRTQGRPFHVLAFSGDTDPESISDTSHLWLSLGEIAKALEFFKTHTVSEIVMAGKFRRPAWKSLKVDWKGTLWIAQLLAQKSLGDDGLLRFLGQKLEGEGFRIVGPQEILRPLLGSAQTLTVTQPSEAALKDIALGFEALRTLSHLDLGQALVVQNGVILGVEGAEGTDALIQRCGLLQTSPGAILVKGAKTHQDLRLDTPTIGPETLAHIIQSGFQGIAFEAHRTLVLYPTQLQEVAQKNGVFIIGIENASLSSEI